MGALAASLGVSEGSIVDIVDDVTRHYRPVKIEKDDGSFRECWDPSAALRRVQRRLVLQLLRKVRYPDYLHGSLPKRDYVTNAKAHLEARWCICMDIRNFFPSISAELVGDAIWSRFFGCDDDVARILTKLTTLDGRVPQGSLTASYLANLVLWRQEPRLVERLHGKGLRYTRYVDDITITSKCYPPSEVKTYAGCQVNAMLQKNGLRLKRGKTTVATAGKGIKIMGLTVGRSVGRGKVDRRITAGDVINYAGLSASLPALEAARLLASLRGRVAELARHHPREAMHLRSILDETAPTSSQS